MDGSFITIDRKILEWEWYEDLKTFKLFIHCLLKANWRDKEWKGFKVKRSTFITSIQTLSNETGLSVKEVRTALKKLQNTKEIKVEKRANLFSLVTICKYDDYQSVREKRGKRGANEGQAKGKRGATTNKSNKSNKSNKDNNSNNIVDVVYREIDEIRHRLLENDKYKNALTTKFKFSEEQLDGFLTEFNQHLETLNENSKIESDYTRHFLAWFCKRYNYDARTGKQKSIHKTAF